jgi:hypothetical protein
LYCIFDRIGQEASSERAGRMLRSGAGLSLSLSRAYDHKESQDAKSRSTCCSQNSLFSPEAQEEPGKNYDTDELPGEEERSALEKRRQQDAQ